jgi:hypothetical protein
MVNFDKTKEKMDWNTHVQLARMVGVDVNKLFVNCPPLMMNLEKIYLCFLLIAAKMYIGIKCVSKDWVSTDVKEMEVKGLKQKKKGTTQLCAKMGEKVSQMALVNRDLEGAVNYVRRKIVKLKKRKITLSKLIHAHTFGGDVTGALYMYMLKQIKSGNKPPPATEKIITAKYFALPNEERQKIKNATPPAVFAYREMCKDPNLWFERGTTIHYIYTECPASQKREAVCSVSDAITNDLPYNVGFYIDEVIKTTQKILCLMVGDTEVKKTPHFIKAVLKHPNVSGQSVKDHKSFFESKYGIKTQISTGHSICDKTISWLGKKEEESKYIKRAGNIVRYIGYTYPKCVICKGSLKFESDSVCESCFHNGAGILQLKKQKQLEKMNKRWDTCKDCLKSDRLDALDCIAVSCFNFTKRIDDTKRYYTKQSKIAAFNDAIVKKTILDW